MFLSVVIPIYNVEKYLRTCIDSILSQTFTDFEIILVDDGSKDGSGKICDEFAAKDKRIKVIHKENAGQAAARNDGIQVASGNYITFIDSDDYYSDNNCLQIIYDVISNKKTDIVIYKYIKKFEKNGRFCECDFSYDFAKDIEDFDEFMLKSVSQNAYNGMAWNKVIKRDKVQKFNERLSCEDMDWFLSTTLDIKTVTAIDKSFVVYRQREGSVTNTIRLKNLLDFIYTIEKWGTESLKLDITEKKKEAIFGALAFYYANLMIVYSRVSDKDKKKEKKNIKALSYVLDYSKDARSLVVKKFYKLFGFELTILALKILDKVKG